jgi:hypothetical protein
MYRVVDLASEMFEPDTGKWIAHDKLFHIGIRGYGLGRRLTTLGSTRSGPSPTR